MGNTVKKIMPLSKIREEHLKSNPLVILKVKGHSPIGAELLPKLGENGWPKYYFGSVKFPEEEIPDELLEKRVYLPGTGTIQSLNINRRRQLNDIDCADLDREVFKIKQTVNNFKSKN